MASTQERAFLALVGDDDCRLQHHGHLVRRLLRESGYAGAVPAYHRLTSSGRGEWYLGGLLALIACSPRRSGGPRRELLKQADALDNFATTLEAVFRNVSGRMPFWPVLLPFDPGEEPARMRAIAAFFRANADAFDGRRTGRREFHLVVLMKFIARSTGQMHYSDLAIVLTALGIRYTEGALEQLYRRRVLVAATSSRPRRARHR